jgi:hypothetical protein
VHSVRDEVKGRLASLLVLAVAACGDRAPPPNFPRADPPSWARPVDRGHEESGADGPDERASGAAIDPTVSGAESASPAADALEGPPPNETDGSVPTGDRPRADVPAEPS